MSLELVVGPMFAGKSSALLAVVRRHVALGQHVLVLTHALDTRYGRTGGSIVNHDLQCVPAHSLAELTPVLDWPTFASAQLVVVEEAQFFPDLRAFVTAAVDAHGKHVVVAGLDGDVERHPFGEVLALLPLADRVTKLAALCRMCRDGTPALFTCLTPGMAPEATAVTAPRVGGAELYMPVCRRHYLQANPVVGQKKTGAGPRAVVEYTAPFCQNREG